MNTVDKLLQTNPRSRNYLERSLIKHMGRETPYLNITQVDPKGNSVITRKFSMTTYNQSEWVTGCPIRNALFCFPCLLLGGDRSPWATSGVTDLKHLHGRIMMHSRSGHHCHSMKTFSELGTVHIVGEGEETIHISQEDTSENISLDEMPSDEPEMPRFQFTTNTTPKQPTFKASQTSTLPKHPSTSNDVDVRKSTADLQTPPALFMTRRDLAKFSTSDNCAIVSKKTIVGASTHWHLKINSNNGSLTTREKKTIDDLRSFSGIKFLPERIFRVDQPKSMGHSITVRNVVAPDLPRANSSVAVSQKTSADKAPAEANKPTIETASYCLPTNFIMRTKNISQHTHNFEKKIHGRSQGGQNTTPSSSTTFRKIIAKTSLTSHENKDCSLTSKRKLETDYIETLKRMKTCGQAELNISKTIHAGIDVSPCKRTTIKGSVLAEPSKQNLKTDLSQPNQTLETDLSEPPKRTESIDKTIEALDEFSSDNLTTVEGSLLTNPSKRKLEVYLSKPPNQTLDTGLLDPQKRIRTSCPANASVDKTIEAVIEESLQEQERIEERLQELLRQQPQQTWSQTVEKQKDGSVKRTLKLNQSRKNRMVHPLGNEIPIDIEINPSEELDPLGMTPLSPTCFTSAVDDDLGELYKKQQSNRGENEQSVKCKEPRNTNESIQKYARVGNSNESEDDSLKPFKIENDDEVEDPRHETVTHSATANSGCLLRGELKIESIDSNHEILQASSALSSEPFSETTEELHEDSNAETTRI